VNPINSMVKLASIMLLSLAVSGCLFNQTKPEPEANPRIIYRDLLAAPAEYSAIDTLPAQSVCEHKTEQVVVVKEVMVACDVLAVPEKEINTASFQVSFRNESSVIDSDLNTELATIKSTLDTQSHYLVVGHSHGKSAKGNNYLASKRADKVSRWLVSNGLPSKNVHKLASWSASKESYAPTKGVQVFKVDENITFSFS